MNRKMVCTILRSAREIGISVDTVRRWLDLLERLHFGFRVRPWSATIAKALRKKPKWFLRDWSAVENPGARAETLAFKMLATLIRGKRWIVLLDKITWLARHSEECLPELKVFIDR